MFVVEADTRQIQMLKLALRNLSPEKLDKVLVRALNRTMYMARTRITNAIWEESTVKHRGAIFKRIEPFEAPTAAIGAALRISHSRINLTEFKARFMEKAGKGVFFQTSKGGGEQQAPQAFIARGKGGFGEHHIADTGPDKSPNMVFVRMPAAYDKARKRKEHPELFGKKNYRYDTAKKDQTEITFGAGKIERVPQYPLLALRGPSIWRIFTGYEKLAEDIIEESKQRLRKHVMDQIELIVNRRKGAVA